MTRGSFVTNTLHNVYDDAGFLATVLPTVHKWHKLTVKKDALRRFVRQPGSKPGKVSCTFILKLS
jgi:hypothetical protein